ncbi:hypothetical protein DV736_g4248, partial [Chaetothyriales sp. CBS 134916]
MKPHIALPDCGKSYAWDLVTVVDPRALDRTLQVYLLTRKVPIAMPTHVCGSEGSPAYKQVLVSPLRPNTKGDDTSPREYITFAVVDSRYPPQIVEMFLTPHQASLLRASILSSDKARPVLTAKTNQLRFKCYVPGCKATSSDKLFLAAHFLNGMHPGLHFDEERVHLFRVNGEEDPAVLKTRSPFIILPAAVEALDGPSKLSSLAGSKRTRVDDQATDLQCNKVTKTDKSTIKINRLVDDYLAKYPVTAEVEAEPDELFCTCLSREDGRAMLKCANDKCRLGQYHLECLGLTGQDLPAPDLPWFCPECIKKAKGGKHPAPLSAHTPSISTLPKIVPPQSCRPRADKPAVHAREDWPGPSRASWQSITAPLSPSVEVNPWSAGIVSSFPKASDSVRDYDLTSLASAKAALQARHAQPLGKPVARPSRPGEEGYEYSKASYKSPNRLSWTAVEEQHLKNVVKECADAGLSGEALWTAAHPKLVARGVNRPVGGMKMRWCRGLRDQTKIDERRKPNNKLLTAIQKPKLGRPATTPKNAKAKNPHPLKIVLDATATSDATEPTASNTLTPSDTTIAPDLAPASNATRSPGTATQANAGHVAQAVPIAPADLPDQHRIVAPVSANLPIVPADLVGWGASKSQKPRDMVALRGLRSRSF